MSHAGELEAFQHASGEACQRAPAGTELRQLQKWLAFRVHDESMALPLSDIESVERVSSINRIPHAPAALRGVTNMRGRIVPVIDLGRRLGGSELQLDAATRLVVLRAGSRPVALLVDAVDDIVLVDLLAIEAPPTEVAQDAPYLLGVHRGEPTPLQLLVGQRLLHLTTRRAR